MRESRTRLLLVAFAVLACAVLAGGCTQSPQLRYEEDLARAPAPARHAVESQRLAELMRGLARLRDERLPRNMDVRGEEERRAARIEKSARAMAEAADLIPAAATDAGLDAAERAEFTRLAGALKRQAQELADAEHSLSRTELETRIEAIQGTCNRCHEQFRIPKGSRAVD